MSDFQDSLEAIDNIVEDELVEEVSELPVVPFLNHCSKVMKKVAKGAKKGQEVIHFDCNYCSKDFQGPSNSTLLKHLRSTHPKKCPELLREENKTKSVRNFFSKTTMKQSFEPDVFMGKLLKWIIKTDQPFSCVDNEYFEDMMDYLKKDITINSRRTIMRRLEELYSQMKGQLKERLNAFKSKYSITCDVWTSKNQLSFFGITIHFIDNEWKMQEHLLSFKYLESEHDGASLAKAMIEVLEDYGIADRLLGVTLDNASNNATMLVEIEKYYASNYPNSGFSVVWNQVECMAHVLNLAAQQILKNFKQPIDSDNYDSASDSADKLVTAVSRLSFLCRKIRLSPKLRRLMAKLCTEKNVEYLVPIIDVCTRWNSTYDMLVRAFEQRDIVSDVLYANKDDKLIKLRLKDSDWDCINRLIKVLRPFKEATLLCSKSASSLMITNVIPIYNYCTEMLKISLEKFDLNDDIYVGIQAGLEKLIHYYDKISPMVGIALVLDPTLKRDFLRDGLGWKREWILCVEENFQSSFLFYQGAMDITSSTQVTTIESIAENDLVTYENYLKRKRNSFSGDMPSEYDRYLSLPLLSSINADILQFWKSNLFNFPTLAAMAKDYLTVQASSVSSERAFSSGTDLVTPNRCSMGGEVIELTQFLKFVL
jgi:hypothetical protein